MSGIFFRPVLSRGWSLTIAAITFTGAPFMVVLSLLYRSHNQQVCHDMTDAEIEDSAASALSVAIIYLVLAALAFWQLKLHHRLSPAAGSAVNVGGISHISAGPKGLSPLVPGPLPSAGAIPMDGTPRAISLQDLPPSAKGSSDSHNTRSY
jgi:hypothetical protein